MSSETYDLARSRLGGSSSTPGWLVVAGQEVRDLWLGGRGPILLLAFSLLLSVITYLTAANKELNLLDQKDTVNLVMQVTLAVGVALALLLSADTLSGERERGTLEALLLAPLVPREIVLGKLLAALTVWPAVVAVSVPYAWALRIGTGLFTDAVASAIGVGTLVAITFASLGVIVSIFSSTNRVSVAVSFFVFVALVVPTQLPGGLGKGWLGDAFSRVNPLTAGAQFMDKVIVSNHSWSQDASWLISPIAAALIAVTVAAVLAGRLRLQGGSGR